MQDNPAPDLLYHCGTSLSESPLQPIPRLQVVADSLGRIDPGGRTHSDIDTRRHELFPEKIPLTRFFSYLGSMRFRPGRNR